MVGSKRPPTIIYGVDFTSAPRAAKPIVVASGSLRDDTFALDGIEGLPTLTAYEQWLRRPGPWVGGFDFPFGLPRAALVELGWPTDWEQLTRSLPPDWAARCCEARSMRTGRSDPPATSIAIDGAMRPRVRTVL
jgi:hypothetical protein